VTLSHLLIEDSHYGLKIGSGPLSEHYMVTDLVTHRCSEPLYVSYLHDALFTNLDLSANKEGTNQYHCLYMEADCVDVTFRNSVFRGGSGYTLHLYHGTGSDEYEEGTVSRNILFENCVIDARTGRYPVVIGEGVGVTFRNCTFIGASSGSIFTFYGGTVLVDGFVASGGDELIDGDADSAIIRNGTYDGPVGSAGNVTLENVQLR
jgi:hypothetical protein